MTAEIHHLETTPGPGRMATPQLRTLVVCDIADSTALVERMGDQSAANIIRKHDRLARALVEKPEAIEWTEADDLASQPVATPLGGAGGVTTAH